MEKQLKVSPLVDKDWPALPYPGLRPFAYSRESNESYIFHGRRAHSRKLRERLATEHMVAVLGPSGCGKSSLVFAGLLDELKAGRMRSAGAAWHACSMTPGRQPVKALSEALSGAVSEVCGKNISNRVETLLANPVGLVDFAQHEWNQIEGRPNLLLIIDQFEEIFRHDFTERGEEKSLVDLLVTFFQSHSERLYIVTTMRTDYLEQCALYRGLPELLNSSQFLVPRLGSRELRAAIERPGRDYGGSIEPALVDHIIADMDLDVGYDADLLPQMQFALMWMWINGDTSPSYIASERKNLPDGIFAGKELSLHNYQKNGGLEGILATRSDEVLAQLPETVQGDAEHMFRLLSLVDERGQIRRRLVSRTDIEQHVSAETSVNAIIEAFGSGPESVLRRVGPSGDVDITHECLIRRWPKFLKWTQSEAQDAAEFKTLAARGRAYFGLTGGRGGDLLGPTDVESFRSWWNERAPTERWARRYQADPSDFALAYRILHESEEALEKADAERKRNRKIEAQAEQASRTKRWMYIVGGVAIVAVVAALAAVSGWNEANKQAAQAEQARNEAVAAKREAEIARKKAEEAELRAKKSARKATRRESLYLADASLQQSSSGSHELATQLASIALPEQLASEATSGRPYTQEAEAALYEAVMGLRGLAEPPKHTGRVIQLVFDPGGRFLLSTSSDKSAQLWDVVSEEVLFRLSHDSAINHASFSADGRWIVTGTQEGLWRIWDAGTGEPLRWRRENNPIMVAEFAPVGNLLAIVKKDGSTRLFDVEDLTAPVAEFGGGKGTFGVAPRLVWSPTGKRMALVYGEGTGALVYSLVDKLSDGSPIELTHPYAITSIEFDRDDLRLLTASVDKTAAIWDARSGNLLMSLRGHHFAVTGAAFDASTRRVITTSHDHTVRIWDTDSGSATHIESAGERLEKLAVGKHRFLTVSKDGQLTLRETRLGGQLARMGGHDGQVTTLALAPHENIAATGDADGVVRVWDTRHSAGAIQLRSGGGAVSSGVFDSSGDRVSTGSKDGVVRNWDAHTGQLLWEEKHHEEEITSLEYNKNDFLLVTGSKDGSAIVWGADGALISRRMTETGSPSPVTQAKFDHSGIRILTAHKDGTVRHWPIKADQSTKPLAEWKDHDGKVSDLRISYAPKRGAILTVGYDGVAVVRVANAESTDNTYGMPRRFSEHGSAIWSGEFSLDGSKIVTASTDGTARIWDVNSGAQLQVLVLDGDDGKTHTVTKARFSDDGTRVVTSSFDTTARVWDVKSGTLLKTLSGHSGWVWDAEFSSDGNRIMTASEDGTARLWDLTRGGESLAWVHMIRHNGTVLSAAFSTRDHRVLTFSDDGTARLTPTLPVGQVLIDYAHNLSLRPMSEKTKRRFFLLPTE